MSLPRRSVRSWSGGVLPKASFLANLANAASSRRVACTRLVRSSTDLAVRSEATGTPVTCTPSAAQAIQTVPSTRVERVAVTVCRDIRPASRTTASDMTASRTITNSTRATTMPSVACLPSVSWR